MQITIVLPTYNESKNLPSILSTLFSLPLPDLKALIVDDNSPDKTGELAESLSVQYPGRIKVIHRPGKMGLGSAYITGFKQALADGADAIGQMDSDFSHPIERLVPMAKALEQADVVIGSRYCEGGSLDESWPLWRKILSGFGNFYARTILNVPIHDITGGFRLYSRKAIMALPLERVRSNGYVFQVEISYISYLLGLKIIEVPIHFTERKAGQSKMSFRIQMEAALRVWQIRGMYQDLKGKINLN